MPARTSSKPTSSEAKVLFLYGEETLLAEEMIDDLRKSFFTSPEEEREGFFRFFLNETNWLTIIETLQTGSLFFSGKKMALVILPEEEEEGGEKTKEEGEGRPTQAVLTPLEEERLREFIASMERQERLIIYYPGRLDRNNRLYRFFSSLDPSCVEAKECRQLKGLALRNWVVNRLARQRMRMTEEAINCLIDATGNDLRSIARELEKLVLYCQEKKEIELEDVAAVCPAIRAYQHYELTQALEEGNRKAALQALSKLLEDKKGKEYTVGALAQFFRELLLARQWLAEGKREVQIFEQLRPQLQRLNPEFIRQKRDLFFRAVKVWNEADLASLLSKLQVVDQSIKGGSDLAEVLLFELIIWFLDKRETGIAFATV